MKHKALAVRRRFLGVLRTNYGTVRGWVRALLGQLEYVVGRLDGEVELTPATVERLVFVCLGNINRSAFGEAVARSQGARVCSIGLSTTTGVPAFAKAVELAPAFGLDLASHTATDFKDYRYVRGDLLLAMEVRHVRALRARGIPAGAIVLLGHWATPHRVHLHDPHTLSDEYFRTCFTLIQSATVKLLGELRVGASPCVRS